MEKKVVIIQELFTSYRGPIFDRLRNKMDLLVIHGEIKSDLKLIEKEYSICVPIFYIFNRFTFIHSFGVLNRFNPRVVIHQGSPGILSLPFVWIWCKLNAAKFVLWTHGYERHQGFKPNRSFRSMIRLFYYKISDAVLFYTRERQEFFKQYLKSDKLFYATNTLDTNYLMKIRDSLQLISREKLQEDLNIRSHLNLVFLGRLLSEKLVIDLLRVTLKLKLDGVKVKTHIIGDGKEATRLVQYAKKNNLDEDVVFYGAIYDDEYLGKILFCSDLMVIPGYVGLSINHAFCFDLPLVTYKQGPEGPFHSPEIEYLSNRETGLLIEPFNIEAMSQSIKELFLDKSLLQLYRNNVRDKVTTDLTIEKMEAGFTKCIAYVIQSKY